MIRYSSVDTCREDVECALDPFAYDYDVDLVARMGLVAHGDAYEWVLSVDEFGDVARYAIVTDPHRIAWKASQVLGVDVYYLLGAYHCGDYAVPGEFVSRTSDLVRRMRVYAYASRAVI